MSSRHAQIAQMMRHTDIPAVDLPDLTIEVSCLIGQSFEIRVGGTVVSCTAYWGDGTSTNNISATATVSHTYTTDGPHTVSVVGVYTTFRVNLGRLYPTKLISLGTNQYTNLTEAFYYTQNMQMLASTGDFSQVVYADEIFREASVLDNLPNAPFGPACITFDKFSYYATSLAHVPPNLFDTCTTGVYNNSFRYCALTQESVGNIVASVHTAMVANNITGGELGMQSGTSSAPDAATQLLIDEMRAAPYLWGVYVNGY